MKGWEVRWRGSDGAWWPCRCLTAEDVLNVDYGVPSHEHRRVPPVHTHQAALEAALGDYHDAPSPAWETYEAIERAADVVLSSMKEAI